MFELAHIAFFYQVSPCRTGAIKASKKKLSGKVNQDIVDLVLERKQPETLGSSG